MFCVQVGRVAWVKAMIACLGGWYELDCGLFLRVGRVILGCLAEVWADWRVSVICAEWCVGVGIVGNLVKLGTNRWLLARLRLGNAVD